MNRMLDINLSTKKIGEYEVTDRERELFLGGKSLAAKILYDNLSAGVDPLAPENILIVNTGPLTGSNGPGTSRFNVTSKNVLTGGIASSNCGGNFGINLKRAGYDGIIIRGRADKPVYIDVNNNNVEIKDASGLWGLTTGETEEKLGKKGGKIIIGPAGENLVKFACIISQERAIGRCGLGAVMGSKNLKAIIAQGTNKVPAADEKLFKKLVKEWVKSLREHPTTGKYLPSYGTSGFINKASVTNVLPTRNFRYGSFEHAEEISGEKLAEKYLIKNSGCMSCPIHCARVVNLKGKEIKGPEFETIGLLGANLENKNLSLIFEWNYLLDQLGMDTISTGVVLGFAMELKEKGLLECELEFGRTDNIAQMMEDIAYRRGLGNDLAEGVKRLAEKYGGEEFAIHSKGLEMASYEPRGAAGQGLGYAVSNRGACHLNAGYMVYFEAIGPINMDPLSPKSKAAYTIFQQNVMEAISSAGNCLFTTYAIIPKQSFSIKPYASSAKLISKLIDNSGSILGLMLRLPPAVMSIHLPFIPHTKVLSALTGMNITLGEFLKIGERCYNIERLFNIREGLNGKDDTLPKRLLEELQDPNNPHSKVPLKEMLNEYYKLRGWEKGKPTKETLRKLNLAFL